MKNTLCCSDNAGPFPVECCLPGKEVPVAVQRKRVKGWKKPDNTVCVTRPGKWGNMFPASVFGAKLAVELYEHFFNVPSVEYLPTEAQKYAVEWLNKYLNIDGSIYPSVRHMAIDELQGRNLACWCKEGEVCHRDVLLKVANAILVQHDPIKVQKISRNNWMASVVYWIPNKRDFKMSAEAFGHTEKEARQKMYKFLNA